MLHYDICINISLHMYYKTVRYIISYIYDYLHTFYFFKNKSKYIEIDKV